MDLLCTIEMYGVIPSEYLTALQVQDELVAAETGGVLSPRHGEQGANAVPRALEGHVVAPAALTGRAPSRPSRRAPTLAAHGNIARMGEAPEVSTRGASFA